MGRRGGHAEVQQDNTRLGGAGCQVFGSARNVVSEKLKGVI